jgi:hypothetical protein
MVAIVADVILSEAKNLGSSLPVRQPEQPEMFESLASCFAFRCSVSLNMTAIFFGLATSVRRRL